jgi:hypothetical protein
MLKRASGPNVRGLRSEAPATSAMGVGTASRLQLCAVRLARGRICRALPFLTTSLEDKHFDLDIGTLVARAHKCRHLAAGQTLNCLGQPAFHGVLERLPGGLHIEPFAVLEQCVLEPAVSPARSAPRDARRCAPPQWV